MRLKELKPKDYHIYVDLDGVMADLQSEVEGILDIKITTAPGGTDWDNSDAIWEKGTLETGFARTFFQVPDVKVESSVYGIVAFVYLHNAR